MVSFVYVTILIINFGPIVGWWELTQHWGCWASWSVSIQKTENSGSHPLIAGLPTFAYLYIYFLKIGLDFNVVLSFDHPPVYLYATTGDSNKCKQAFRILVNRPHVVPRQSCGAVHRFAFLPSFYLCCTTICGVLNPRKIDRIGEDYLGKRNRSRKQLLYQTSKEIR